MKANAGTAERMEYKGLVYMVDGFAQRFGSYWLPMAASWPILAFILVLLGFISYMTFVPGLPTEPGLTLQYWANLANPYVVETVIPNTILVGIGTVVVSMIFAIPLAWILNRTAIPCRRLFITLIGVTVVIPGFVKAMAWLILLNERNGLINNLLSGLLGINLPLSVENTFGMAWVLGLTLTPSMFFLISGPVRALGVELEEAAVVAGATWWRRFVWIDLGLLWPAILGAAIYNFMTAIAIFEVPAMLGAGGGKRAVLATELFYAVHPTSQGNIEFGAAGVYGMLIIIPSLFGLIFYYRMLAQAHRYGVITGKGYKPKDVELGKMMYLAGGFVIAYLLLAVVLPVVVLLWSSLLPFLQMPSWEAVSKLSFENYRNFITVIGGWSVLKNTIELIIVVPLLVIFFSFATSWVVVRTESKLRRVMDMIAFFPHAVPGIAFAFALFLLGLLISRWIPLYGTLAIIVIAHTVSFLAAGTRITNAALLQLHRDLEEAAYVCRAGFLGTMWKVVIPLVRPSLVYAMLWVALLSGREVSMGLLLAENDNQVFSVAVWSLWQNTNEGPATAAAVVLILGMGSIALLALWLSRGAVLGERV